jgi:4,5-dihydroxyphthalate decarboxylase
MAATLPLTLGFGEYDRTEALRTGEVSPEGIDLTYECISPPSAIFGRMLHDEAFDASEMSLSNYLMGLSQGDRRFIALPVFPSRTFRHSFIWINAEAGIREPRDLIGKRIGCPDYSMTALLYIRGLLQHEYGVAPDSVRWVRGRPEKTVLKLPAGVQVEDAPAGARLPDLLESGAIDALASTSPPPRSPRIARLIPNSREVEAAYFRRTGIFPIMHTVVLRRPIYEANPWAAASLANALQRAKEIAAERLRRDSSGVRSLPWGETDLEELDDLFGGDAYPYGVAANRATLEAALDYSYEQGLSERRLALDDLFAPEAVAALG